MNHENIFAIPPCRDIMTMKQIFKPGFFAPPWLSAAGEKKDENGNGNRRQRFYRPGNMRLSSG
ncbi:MAG: hypothetical protein IIC13_00325 [SAR324 cluster bacterium]|nr:hypothetical protein [SAR324 cluster bacterium]MCH8885008.1 hypothetical protein [SAR324 cluster bacterium]